MEMPDLQQYPWNLELIKNVESDTIFFAIINYYKQEMRN